MDVERLAVTDLLRVCLRSSSEDAWREFVRRFQPAIASAVRKALQRWSRQVTVDLVDDLVQQTFLRLCAEDFRPLRTVELTAENAFFGYLRTIATNITIDHMRQPAPRLDPLPETLPDGRSPDADFALLMVGIERQLVECAAGNPDRDRRVFWLYYRTGMSSKAIAAISMFHLTQKGVESLLLRLTRCIRRGLVEGKRPPDPLYEEGGSQIGAA